MVKPEAVTLLNASDGKKIVKPGFRYAARRAGEEHKGQWVADGSETPLGLTDVFTEGEARLMLPLLRSRGTAGRKADNATTPDGELISRVMEAFGLTAAALASKLGVDPSVLSRGRRGKLAPEHHAALLDLLPPGKQKRGYRRKPE
jgi:hypothetical protein